MAPVSSVAFQTCQHFTNGDDAGGPRFKIDRFADWSEAYPSSDYYRIAALIDFSSSFVEFI